MKESKQDRQTRNVELVEIGNIAKSIKRVSVLRGDYGNRRWRRVLLYAIEMAGKSDNMIQKIRVALELP